MFVEDDLNRPLSAFTDLVAAARRDQVAGVVVPAPDDLGRLPRVQDLMRSWLDREARVPLLVAQPFETAPAVPPILTLPAGARRE